MSLQAHERCSGGLGRAQARHPEAAGGLFRGHTHTRIYIYIYIYVTHIYIYIYIYTCIYIYTYTWRRFRCVQGVKCVMSCSIANRMPSFGWMLDFCVLGFPARNQVETDTESLLFQSRRAPERACRILEIRAWASHSPEKEPQLKEHLTRCNSCVRVGLLANAWGFEVFPTLASGARHQTSWILWIRIGMPLQC